MSAALDHLVIAASTLAEGVAWCETTLGTTPGPGGEHALFGTHNRLLKLQTPGAPHAYLEIIAVNPLAQPTRSAPLKRWFDLDDATLQNRLQQEGPQLVHWVASVPDLNASLATWRALGIDGGPALDASRPTPTGLLQWQIAVRDDGARLLGGCLPTLIQWGAAHPAPNMPTSGLALRGLRLSHPQHGLLDAALRAIGLNNVEVHGGDCSLLARLGTPMGETTLVH